MTEGEDQSVRTTLLALASLVLPCSADANGKPGFDKPRSTGFTTKERGEHVSFVLQRTGK
jgi:hypothetical protein